MPGDLCLILNTARCGAYPSTVLHFFWMRIALLILRRALGPGLKRKGTERGGL